MLSLPEMMKSIIIQNSHTKKAVAPLHKGKRLFRFATFLTISQKRVG